MFSSPIWTPEMDAKLRERVAAGMSDVEIAAAFGWPAGLKYRVLMRRRKFGLAAARPSRRVWTADDDDFLRREYHLRGGKRRIADRFGVSLVAVHQRAQSIGVSRTLFVWTREADDTLARLNADGRSDRQIAKAIGCSFRSVAHRRRQLGLPGFVGMTDEHRAACSAMARFRPVSVKTAAAVRAFAERYGLPPDLRLQEAHILIVLATDGPSTRRQIAARLGVKARSVDAQSRRPMSRDGNVRRGYIGGLSVRGLIVRLPRDGGPHRFTLSSLALAMLSRTHSKPEQEAARHGS